jgi:conserved repeat domain
VLFGEYLVADVQLTAVKSQTIVDQFGGARPLPGARINYQVVVTPSGSGNATAAAFSDRVPTNTTYVGGSLRLNGASLSDGADADAGTFVSAPAPEVRVTLGNLAGGSGPQTIEFAVTIN